MKRIVTIKDVPEEDLVVGGAPLCGGCPADMGLKLALKALGRNTVVINSSGCMTLFVTYPNMPLKVPWIHVAIENAGAVASGLDAALRQLKRRKGVQLLCYVGDGATYDIGFQALSGAVTRGTDFIYVCYNNNSFSNTGMQMSSATPFAAETSTTPSEKGHIGNAFRRKPMAKIIAAHGAPYVATACISNPLDFMKKLQKAASIPGPKFIDLLAPCPTGWGFDASQTVRVGDLAIKTGAWPLYEIERGTFRMTYKPAVLLPIERYLKTQRRFQHLTDPQMKIIQNYINMEWDHLSRGDYWNAIEY
jgi:pyruvate ferredoxin oxidoreductase beta subunit